MIFFKKSLANQMCYGVALFTLIHISARSVLLSGVSNSNYVFSNFRKRSENELYANPRSLIGSTERPIGEDCISLCSNFSYFSECTNASTGVPEDETLSSFSSERLADMTPFRFSPTSFISDTMSLPDFDDDAGQSSSSFAYLELQRDVGNVGSCLRYIHKDTKKQ